MYHIFLNFLLLLWWERISQGHFNLHFSNYKCEQFFICLRSMFTSFCVYEWPLHVFSPFSIRPLVFCPWNLKSLLYIRDLALCLFYMLCLSFISCLLICLFIFFVHTLCREIYQSFIASELESRVRMPFPTLRLKSSPTFSSHTCTV